LDRLLVHEKGHANNAIAIEQRIDIKDANRPGIKYDTRANIHRTISPPMVRTQ
jgi:hypothetical protein